MRRLERDMDFDGRINGIAGPAEAYRTPQLIVHGTVAEVTRGQGGGEPDGSANTSQLPDGQDPI